MTCKINIGVFFTIQFARKTKISVKYKLAAVFVKKKRKTKSMK